MGKFCVIGLIRKKQLPKVFRLFLLLAVSIGLEHEGRDSGKDGLVHVSAVGVGSKEVDVPGPFHVVRGLKGEIFLRALTVLLK